MVKNIAGRSARYFSRLSFRPFLIFIFFAWLLPPVVAITIISQFSLGLIPTAAVFGCALTPQLFVVFVLQRRFLGDSEMKHSPGDGGLATAVDTLNLKLESVTRELEQEKKRRPAERLQLLSASHSLASAISFLNVEIKPTTPVWFTFGWPASPELLARLYSHIISTKPELVLDLGSGLTTLVAAAALEKNGCGSVIAWEPQGKYAQQTRELLEEHGLSHRADVQDSPLEPLEIDGREFHWYSKRLSHGKIIDTLIVDGPPAMTCELARYPAIPILKDHLAENAVVFLDDTSRPEEQKILSMWQQMLGRVIIEEEELGSGKAFAVFNLVESNS